MAKKTSKKNTKKRSNKGCGTATTTTTGVGGRTISTTKTIVNPGVNNQI